MWTLHWRGEKGEGKMAEFCFHLDLWCQSQRCSIIKTFVSYLIISNTKKEMYLKGQKRKACVFNSICLYCYLVPFSLSQSDCLYLFHSLSLSVSLNVSLFLSTRIYLSHSSLSVYLYVCLSLSASLYLFIHLPMYLSLTHTNNASF
jgi:hypothetical protein